MPEAPTAPPVAAKPAKSVDELKAELAAAKDGYAAVYTKIQKRSAEIKKKRPKIEAKVKATVAVEMKEFEDEMKKLMAEKLHFITMVHALERELRGKK